MYKNLETISRQICLSIPIINEFFSKDNRTFYKKPLEAPLNSSISKCLIKDEQVSIYIMDAFIFISVNFVFSSSIISFVPHFLCANWTKCMWCPLLHLSSSKVSILIWISRHQMINGVCMCVVKCPCNVLLCSLVMIFLNCKIYLKY